MRAPNARFSFWHLSQIYIHAPEKIPFKMISSLQWHGNRQLMHQCICFAFARIKIGRRRRRRRKAKRNKNGKDNLDVIYFVGCATDKSMHKSLFCVCVSSSIWIVHETMNRKKKKKQIPNEWKKSVPSSDTLCRFCHTKIKCITFHSNECSDCHRTSVCVKMTPFLLSLTFFFSSRKILKTSIMFVIIGLHCRTHFEDKKGRDVGRRCRRQPVDRSVMLAQQNLNFILFDGAFSMVLRRLYTHTHAHTLAYTLTLLHPTMRSPTPTTSHSTHRRTHDRTRFGRWRETKQQQFELKVIHLWPFVRWLVLNIYSLHSVSLVAFCLCETHAFSLLHLEARHTQSESESVTIKTQNLIKEKCDTIDDVVCCAIAIVTSILFIFQRDFSTSADCLWRVCVCVCVRGRSPHSGELQRKSFKLWIFVASRHTPI